MRLTREEAKAEIKDRIPITDFLQRSRSGLYICPFCGSGTGPHKTGAVKHYPETNTISCFAACALDSPGTGRKYDLFDVYMKTQGADYNTALNELADRLNIEIVNEAPYSHKGENVKPIKAEPLAEQVPDYTEYYKACMDRLDDPAAVSYLTARGISLETARALSLGYDPEADPANNPGGSGRSLHPSPRIIIPSTTSHYVGRATDPDTAPEYAKMNAKGSKPGIFNEGILYTQEVQEVFITEGVFDALSVLEVGAAAIALNSAANAQALIDHLKTRRTGATLILCLDNDKAGEKATQTLREGLQALNISYIIGNVNGDYKDPNEFLQQDRKGFEAAIKRELLQFTARPDSTRAYIETRLFLQDLNNFKSNARTGFYNLDQEASGIYEGLYVIAAISSLGKTTFALQIADQMAAAGNEVLFFSLEQSRLELVTKSIARMTAQADKNTATSSLDIRRGKATKTILPKAAEYMETIGERLSIIELNFNGTVTFIGDYIRRHIERTGTKPVVFIDYLQVIQPEADKNGRKPSTKEAIDGITTALKRLSRELGLTVFVISSVNRSNYLNPVDYESLKESGSIEYTADVIWGLQLACLDEPVFQQKEHITEKREAIKKAKAEDPRKIQLVCLKNRYGIANFTCSFKYYPKYDLFEPSGNINIYTLDEVTADKLRKRL